MATIQELISQFSTDLESDVKAIRTALSGKGVSGTTDLKLSGVAEKIKGIKINYTGSIVINYPTAWNSGYIFYKKKGVTGEASRVVCNGSGKATVTVTEPGTYVVTNSHQEEDSTEVVFSA